MANFFLLSLMVAAVSIVDCFTTFSYPSAVPYGYAVNAPYPVAATLRQSSLGPFFGYFPNMLPQQQKCECPAPPKEDSISECITDVQDAFSVLSSAPSGKIEINKESADTSLACHIPIAAAYPNAKVSVTCSAKSSTLEIVMFNDIKEYVANDPKITANGEVNTEYTSLDNGLLFRATRPASATPSAFQVSCTWKSIPA